MSPIPLRFSRAFCRASVRDRRFRAASKAVPASMTATPATAPPPSATRGSMLEVRPDNPPAAAPSTRPRVGRTQRLEGIANTIVDSLSDCVGERAGALYANAAVRPAPGRYQCSVALSA